MSLRERLCCLKETMRAFSMHEWLFFCMSGVWVGGILCYNRGNTVEGGGWDVAHWYL